MVGFEGVLLCIAATLVSGGNVRMLTTTWVSQIRALFDTMLRRGESIDSIRATTLIKAANFRDERARLGELAKTPFWGVDFLLAYRHAYGIPRIARPGWTRHDMSIAFNDAAGYHLGIGQPFTRGIPTRMQWSVLQIPSLLMDGALLYDPARSVESIEAEVEKVLEMAKRYHATATMIGMCALASCTKF